MTKIQVAGYDVLLSKVNSFWDVIAQLDYSSLFFLVDENTKQHCLPILETTNKEKISYQLIQIESGELNKNLATCKLIWDELITHNADRNSILINLGGGVIGDMGGFCASTYMRGIRFIQIPTTLLSQVDASVGGKLGIDHQSLKNIIGLFKNPEVVFADPVFFISLPTRQLKSGFAEVFKHALIKYKEHWQFLCEIKNIQTFDDWEALLLKSISIKKEVVEKDPLESSYRKILNFGHTIGHAIESLYLNTDSAYLHGEAIALGMICESYLSFKKNGLSKISLEEINDILLKHYALQKIKESDFQQLLSLMQKDKKNSSGTLLLSLLSEIGNCSVNIQCQPEEIIESLRYFNTLIS